MSGAHLRIDQVVDLRVVDAIILRVQIPDGLAQHFAIDGLLDKAGKIAFFGTARDQQCTRCDIDIP